MNLVFIIFLIIVFSITLFLIFYKSKCGADCNNKKCGDKDGCGGYCGCPNGGICKSGVCCSPNCKEGTCGESDGCGGICNCVYPKKCYNKICCSPVCKDGDCGENDGCGGICGCGLLATCVNGKCSDNMIWTPTGQTPPTKNSPNVKCVQSKGTITAQNESEHSCLNEECSKGTCCLPTQKWNSDTLKCDDVCQPTCVNKKCGDDGCGGNCGNCDSDKDCINNQCVLANWAQLLPLNINNPVCTRQQGTARTSASENKISCLNDICSKTNCCDKDHSPWITSTGECTTPPPPLPTIWVYQYTAGVYSFCVPQKGVVIAGVNDTEANCMINGKKQHPF